MAAKSSNLFFFQNMSFFGVFVHVFVYLMFVGPSLMVLGCLICSMFAQRLIFDLGSDRKSGSSYLLGAHPRNSPIASKE